MASRRNLLLGGAMAALAPAGAAAREPARFRVAHLTDLHVMPELRSAAGLERALASCLEERPDLVLFGGDLIMDAFEADLGRVRAQWKVMKSVIDANVAVPSAYLIGNHDVWGWGDVARYRGERLFGKRFAVDALGLSRSYQSFRRGGWHFVLLDSVHPVEGNGYTARLDEAQFAWLEAELAGVPREVPVIVVSHIPILSACAYFDGENEKTGSWQVPEAWMHVDARRIKDLFTRHPNVKLCLSGHIHLADRVDYLGVTYLCNGAVSGGWWRGPYQECANGYGLVDLHADGTFSHAYRTFAWTADERPSR